MLLTITEAELQQLQALKRQTKVGGALSAAKTQRGSGGLDGFSPRSRATRRPRAERPAVGAPEALPADRRSI